ncbi:MAG: sensor histidine kinase [Anaerolineae bacterium]|jgi:two-component system sensor histidine kinase DegS|nr:sensor histidine kinase [Anaerolineae bacterium]
MAFDRDELESGDPRAELIDLLTQEISLGKRRLTEIKDQVTAMQTAVDREQNRYSGIAAELRNIKDNLDTVPREDIRDKYDEALEVRFRLATMRGQLEQNKGSYELLEQRQKLFADLLSKVQGAASISSGGPDSAGGSEDETLDIIGIIRAQEDERLRLSRALHDGPAQSLTNFILQAEICQRLFDRNPEKAAEELGNLKTNASSAFQKVREFIFDLRPMMLDDLGVAPTVRRYVESFGDKNDIETRLELLNESRRLEKHREVLIFRSIQDAMTMARDYGAPTEISVRLDMSGDKVRMVIQDNGRGFDASGVLDGSRGDTGDARVQSLSILNGRIKLVKGNVEIKSSENEGTTLRMELPAGEMS